MPMITKASAFAPSMASSRPTCGPTNSVRCKVTGSAVPAAEQTGRACYAVEIHPAYVDMAVTRWQEFTGQEATHADTGKTFDVVAQARSLNG